jgi:hypothetical protein
MNCSNCTFLECTKNILNSKTNSKCFIQNLKLENLSNSECLFCLDSTEGVFLDCKFINTRYRQIYSYNNSNVLVGRCSFDGNNSNYIQLSFNRCSFKIYNCSVQNSKLGFIFYNNSKGSCLNCTFNNIFENGITSYNNSQVSLTNSTFNQNKIAIVSYSSSTIKVVGCTIVNSKEASLNSEDDALINISESTIKQSNDSIQFTKIVKNGKLELKNVHIEGGKKIFPEFEFTDSKKVDIEELYFNGVLQDNFHFEKK